jgi:hypothetical protein
VEFSGGEVKVAISGVDDAAASPVPPVPQVVVPAAPPIDHSFSRDTSDDTEPVSIGDLEALFQPGHAPPSWSDPAGPASSDRAPISAAIESSPPSFQPVSDRDLVIESDRPRAAPPAPKAGRKPSFFDTDGAPAPLARLFDAAPAPFDPTVPALPVRLDPPDLPDDYRDNSDSGLLDIRSLVARDGDQHPPTRREENRVDDDIFNLSGGLFAAGSGGPLAAPDLSALIAPVLPESTRPGPLTAPKKAAPQRASATAATSIDTASAGASAPVVSERRASPAAMAASRRSSRAGWAVAAVLGGGLLVVSIKLGKSTTTTTVMAVETAAPIGLVETAKPVIASPIATTAPVASAEPTVAAIDPGSRGARPKDPVAAIPGTAAPRSTGPTAAVAPVVAAPVVTTPPIAAPPPPPAAGAEFDRSAAVASLTAAAGRAVGCKQPDDPSGGATVSVTFAPSGRVTSSKVTSAPFQGTVMGGCIASAFRSASVPPFEGAPVTVTKNVSIR